ncbi:hypothetical protein [Paratractidigestivibacter sp.]|uniref:hypothetical protein n=1 Tax=Paratractidigestivibacter sp. TaxID=2847316 RepID=UPI002AC94196|nr:hypothetical protein [Paratractidigestivibacter sp.]
MSVKLLIIDDFLTTPIETASSVDLFEILEARKTQEGDAHSQPARAQRMVPAHRG